MSGDFDDPAAAVPAPKKSYTSVSPSDALRAARKILNAVASKEETRQLQPAEAIAVNARMWALHSENARLRTSSASAQAERLEMQKARARSDELAAKCTQLLAELKAREARLQDIHQRLTQSIELLRALVDHNQAIRGRVWAECVRFIETVDAELKKEPEKHENGVTNGVR